MSRDYDVIQEVCVCVGGGGGGYLVDMKEVTLKGAVGEELASAAKVDASTLELLVVLQGVL